VQQSSLSPELCAGARILSLPYAICSLVSTYLETVRSDKCARRVYIKAEHTVDMILILSVVPDRLVLKYWDMAVRAQWYLRVVCMAGL